MKRLLVPVLLLALAAPAQANPFTPTIVNGDERGATFRFDTDGDAVDAHDGEIRRPPTATCCCVRRPARPACSTTCA